MQGTASRSRSANEAWDCDGELVDQILAGSSDHFDLLYTAYFPRVYAFALKRLHDPSDAEDVTQEVFIILLKALPSFKGESSLLVWTFGITRNTVNRRFRYPRPRFEPFEEDRALDVLGVGEAPVDHAVDLRRTLKRCLASVEKDLTPLQRRIFHLRHLRQQPIRKIADDVGKSEDSVKKNLSRMRRTIASAAPGLDGILRT